MKSKEYIYLDYAASTPVDPEVMSAMMPYFMEKYGNPSSLHSFGQEAIAAIDKSRETIARAIGADFEEVIFTGSATEANNLALRGAIKAFRRNNKSFSPRIIVSAIEHESVLETAKDLEHSGVEVVYLPVDRNGFVSANDLRDALNERTVLVSIMYANNEIGIVEPISVIGEEIRKWKIKNIKNKDYGFPLLHTDAVQAFQFLDCDVRRIGVDLMTLSAHKIYGPKGIGALYMKRQNRDKPKFLEAAITGGGQEFGLRSGTENVASIIGFAKAIELVLKIRSDESKRLKSLTDYFLEELKQICPGVGLNDAEPRLPNILSIYLPQNLAHDLLIKFDKVKVAISSGSACTTRSPEPSHVLTACGFSKSRALETCRISFGRYTTKPDLVKVLEEFRELLK
ncbi:cysteine desulfurase [Candidatus Jorgensenbacteria bacterium]|nr:cysteine desulfurase [Candidatus Jorgensenbacteria bacterium]